MGILVIIINDIRFDFRVPTSYILLYCNKCCTLVVTRNRTERNRIEIILQNTLKDTEVFVYVGASLKHERF